MSTLHRWDDRLFLAVNDFARSTPWLHPLAIAYAVYGVVLFAAALVAALLLVRHDRTPRLAAAGWAGVAVLLAEAVNQPIGHLVGERRPYDVLPGVQVLIARTTDVSFPSDHAVMAGAAAAGAWLVARRLGLLVGLAGVLLALTRVYVGAHYPWDVVAGLAVGAAVALLGWWALRPALVALTGRLRGRPWLRSAFAPSARVDAPVASVASVAG